MVLNNRCLKALTRTTNLTLRVFWKIQISILNRSIKINTIFNKMEVILKEKVMLRLNIRKKISLKIWMLFQTLLNQTFSLTRKIRTQILKCKLMVMMRMFKIPLNLTKIQKTEGNKWSNKMLNKLIPNPQMVNKM